MKGSIPRIRNPDSEIKTGIQMATTDYVNIFARDIKKLSGFYIDVFGFEEIKEMRYPLFRAVKAGKINIGFNALDAYELLELTDYSETHGISFLLNFNCKSKREVDEIVEKARNLGATVIKMPYKTYYNWYQAVLLDPEDNCFRVNKIL